MILYVIKENEMYTILEVAELLNVSRITIVRKINNGTINAVKIGKGWRISSGEVDRIMKNGIK
jgi:excisionase family DNA binding protein